MFGSSNFQILRHFNPKVGFHLNVFTFQACCCSIARYKLFIIVFLLWIFVMYFGYILLAVHSYSEIIPFQKDLQLFRRNVFIDGELEAYERTQAHLNYSVDCKHFHRKHTKQDDFVYVAVLTSKRTVETLGRAAYDTWGQEPDKIDFFVGNAPLCDKCKDLPVVKLDGKLAYEVNKGQQYSDREINRTS